MNALPGPAKSSTPAPMSGDVTVLKSVFDEEDLALGLECANPALQIELWGRAEHQLVTVPLLQAVHP